MDAPNGVDGARFGLAIYIPRLSIR